MEEKNIVPIKSFQDFIQNYWRVKTEKGGKVLFVILIIKEHHMQNN